MSTLERRTKLGLARRYEEPRAAAVSVACGGHGWWDAVDPETRIRRDLAGAVHLCSRLRVARRRPECGKYPQIERGVRTRRERERPIVPN
jgi:hypothetical protein